MPSSMDRPKACVILMCLVLLVMETLDSYLHPTRFLMIPISAGIAVVIAIIVNFVPGAAAVPSQCERERLVKENSEMCQTIHRMSEEHRLLCEIRSSISHLRKTTNESVYLLHQLQKLVKRVRSKSDSHGEAPAGCNPVNSVAITSSTLIFDYEKARNAFRQTASCHSSSGVSSVEGDFNLQDGLVIAYQTPSAQSIEARPGSPAVGRSVQFHSASNMLGALRRKRLCRSSSFDGSCEMKQE